MKIEINSTSLLKPASRKAELNAIKYKNLLDASLSGLVLLSHDCRIMEVNQRGAELLGFDISEDIGKSLFDFLMPDKCSSFFNDLKNVISQPSVEIREEYKFITLNGNHEWLDIDFQNHLNDPLMNAILLNFHDITILKEKVENLKGEKERYDILAKATTDTIWEWDIINDQMNCNSGITETFGYLQSELDKTENWWQKKIHPKDLKKVINKINKVLKRGDHQMQFKYRFLCSDGTYKYIYDRAFVIFDSNNKPIRMIGAMKDETQFRNQLLSIRRQNLILKKIAWTQSHVVRAPLARIMGLINLLKVNPTEEILDHMSTAATELDNVLRDIVKETE